MLLCQIIAGWEANSVDPDKTPRSAASHLDLHCLLMAVCPNIYGKFITSNALTSLCNMYPDVPK